MIRIRSSERGTLLPVRVQPGSRREELAGIHNGTLRIRVHPAPENGKANDAVRKQLAKILECRKNSLHIVSGQTSRDKWILIQDQVPSSILHALHNHLNPSKEIPSDDLSA